MIRAGRPPQRWPPSSNWPGSVVAPAATITSSATTVPGARVQPMPMRLRAPMRQSAMRTLWAIVVSRPMTTPSPRVRITVLSWMLLRAPTTIGPTSASRAQENSTVAFSPSRMRPRSEAVRATNTLSSTSNGSEGASAPPSPAASRRRSARSVTSSRLIGRTGRAGVPA